MPSPDLHPVHGFAFHALGGQGRIRIARCTRSHAEAAIVDSIGWLRSAEARFSRFLPDSLISRLNRGERVKNEPELRELVSAAKRAFFLTSGRVDVSALPVWELWHDPSRKCPPTEAELKQAMELKGLLEIDSNKEDLQLPRPGMSLDFGGIAKEWCVDQLVLRLEALGLGNFLVELAGDVAARGRQSEALKGWWVMLSQSGKAVLLQNAALATSGHGSRFRNLGDQRISHLLDARTGQPSTPGLRSATILAESCLEAGITASHAALAPDLKTAHERALSRPALFRTAANPFMATPSLLLHCRDILAGPDPTHLPVGSLGDFQLHTATA